MYKLRISLPQEWMMNQKTSSWVDDEKTFIGSDNDKNQKVFNDDS